MFAWGGLKNGEPLILEDCESPETHEDFQRIQQAAFDEIIQLENSSDWEKIPYSDERVSLAGKALPGSPLKCVRTSAIFNGSPKNVHAFMTSDDITKRKKWDTELLELKVIQKSGDIEVVFQTYKAPFGVTNRSFVATRSQMMLPNGTIIVGGTSINHKDCPFNSSYVRGTATSAIIYEPVNGDLNKCKMTRLVKLDPKGSIPTMAINLGIRKAGDSTVTLINVIKEESKHWDLAVDQPKPSLHNSDVTNDGEEGFAYASDGSDDEHLFFETSDFLEIPDSVIEEKIGPLHQRLAFVESNTVHAAKKMESLLRKTKKMARLSSSGLSFFNFSHLTRIFIVLWPIVVILLFNWMQKRRRRIR